eukprot:1838549-Rhodomonas_salina.1
MPPQTPSAQAQTLAQIRLEHPVSIQSSMPLLDLQAMHEAHTAASPRFPAPEHIAGPNREPGDMV